MPHFLGHDIKNTPHRGKPWWGVSHLKLKEELVTLLVADRFYGIEIGRLARWQVTKPDTYDGANCK